MIGHLLNWAELFVRWFHFIAGVAWIGASFYFIWVENSLIRGGKQRSDDLVGHLWAVHGGGFYYLEKYKVTPPALPPQLHWFKWEAYTTWYSGILLLTLVYYLQADSWLLLKPNEFNLSAGGAILVSIGTIASSYALYLAVCSTPLLAKPKLLSLLGVLGIVAIAWSLGHVLTPRAVFLHAGAIIGTIMVANVFTVIIPSQKRLVATFETGEQPAAEQVTKAGLRSVHNNYLTLPVLLMMVSSHYPILYLSDFRFLVLSLLFIGSLLIRHAFNYHNNGRSGVAPLATGGVVCLLIAVFLTAPYDTLNPAETATKVTIVEVKQLVDKHCVSCHSATPTDPVFTVAPIGFVLDTNEQIVNSREVIHQRVVVDRSMPFNNQSMMTDQERVMIAEWYRDTAQDN